MITCGIMTWSKWEIAFWIISIAFNFICFLLSLTSWEKDGFKRCADICLVGNAFLLGVVTIALIFLDVSFVIFGIFLAVLVFANLYRIKAIFLTQIKNHIYYLACAKIRLSQ